MASMVDKMPEPPKSYANATHEGLDGTSQKAAPPQTRRSKADTRQRQNDTKPEYQYVDVNGELLTSIKPPLGMDGQIEPSSRSKADSGRRDSLVSGRRAGAGWERSKVRFAPFNIPLQRRLQTLVVLLHSLTIAIFLSIFFFVCAIPILWPILLLYVIYLLFSNRASSGNLPYRSSFLRGSKIWSAYASYFPARLYRSVALEPHRKYIFGYHPHGVISHGAFAAFATEALGFRQLFPGITVTLLTLESNFRIPFYSLYALAMGLAPVSRESCENVLSRGGSNGEGMGRAIALVIGGAQESLYAQPGTMRLVLHRRKGFIKLAIRTGADLVPTMGFGENDLYDQVQSQTHPSLHHFQLQVKKLLGWTLPLIWARGMFNYDIGMMPYRHSLNIVTGRPIAVVQQKRPSEEYVDRIHDEYCTELERIFADWKDTFAGDRRGEFEIVE
ncbi:MAG: diacylglycerol O-acyltransferase 1 [Caeruleum heppii]|nr:MAG: diacylglycerol O-acyltransferase 1 [Caeruleum heppii]